MVKALCCHTFARQNLFSPVTKATAVTSADSLALVASEDLRIRVYDLNDPSTVLSEIVTSGRVRSLSVCAKGMSDPKYKSMCFSLLLSSLQIQLSFHWNPPCILPPQPRPAELSGVTEISLPLLSIRARFVPLFSLLLRLRTSTPLRSFSSSPA